MVEYEVGNWPSIWDPPDIWKLLQLKAEFKNTIKYGKVPVLGTKKYYIIRHNNLGRRHIEFRQMSIRGTANNCKTAQPIHAVESASDDYNFSFINRLLFKDIFY